MAQEEARAQRLNQIANIEMHENLIGQTMTNMYSGTYTSIPPRYEQTS